MLYGESVLGKLAPSKLIPNGQERRSARAAAVLTADESFDIDAFQKEARPVQQQLTAARTALKDAEKFARSREDAWDRLSTIISETRTLAEAWPNLGEEERKILLDYWLCDVQIIVEPVPVKLRANTGSGRGGAPHGAKRP